MIGGKEGGSFILASALALSVGVAKAEPAEGGESMGPYCQTAVESTLPFDEAKSYWAMKSYKNSDGTVEILLCEDEARIDAVTIVNPGSVGIKEGEAILDSAGCKVTREERREFPSLGVVSQYVDIDYTQACAESSSHR